MCTLLWKFMTWCHHYQITLRARHIPGCLNVMVDLSRSNQVQSTEWSLHPQAFKQICQKWFIPHVDLFDTRLSHKVPLYVSPVPDQNAWDALNINWLDLTAYAYPPMALLHRVIQKIRQCNDLIIVIAPGWFWDLVQLLTEIPLVNSFNNTSQTVPQLCVSTTSQPPRLVSRSRQLQEQGFSVEVAERIAAPQRSSTRTIYKSKWARFEKWCRETSVNFSRPSIKQVSDFFMYLLQDLNRHLLTIDGYRTAIVDTLGPVGHHISESSDLNRLLSSFHRDSPKSSRDLPNGTFLLYLMSSPKHPLSL